MKTNYEECKKHENCQSCTPDDCELHQGKKQNSRDGVISSDGWVLDGCAKILNGEVISNE